VAIDQPNTQVISSRDARRWVAFRAFGAKRLLLVAQSAMEDIEGAAEAGQVETAVLRARALVLECLSVRSLARAGDLETSSSVTFDPFAGLTEDEIAEGLALVDVDLQSPAEERIAAWVAGLAAYLADTEALLGYDVPLPTLRSPEGTYGALRLARQWSATLNELGLPDLIPDVWTKPQK
jgi:hypothetical protein